MKIIIIAMALWASFSLSKCTLFEGDKVLPQKGASQHVLPR